MQLSPASQPSQPIGTIFQKYVFLAHTIAKFDGTMQLPGGGIMGGVIPSSSSAATALQRFSTFSVFPASAGRADRSFAGLELLP